jgi:hypothetical protein
MLRSGLVVVAVMVVAGWPSLSVPFRGDEAVYAVYAREMAGGAVLYRDVWDVTNPGVFWFYELAGVLFGFSEGRIRAFEWLWVTAFVLTVSEVTRRAYGLNRLPLAPALFVGGTYYLVAYAGTSLLTRVEGLVGFPLFVALWAASRAAAPEARPLRWAVAAGLAGGVVLAFKLLFAACLAVCWGYLILEALRRRGLTVSLRAAAGLVVGVGLVVGAVAASFAANGALGDLTRTLFELPPRFLEEGPRAGVNRLTTSVQWFVGLAAPVLALALLGGVARWRQARDPLVVALGLLFVASCGVILVQRWSWWQYHFLLLVAPVGVLAGYGWEAVARAIRERLTRSPTGREQVALTLAGALAFAPALGVGAYQYLWLVRHRMGLTAEDRAEGRAEMGRAYQVARKETDWLRAPGARPGPIYVCGDPLFYWLSGRSPAVRTSGWSLELYPAVVRNAVTEELRAARPVYVFVAREPFGYDQLLRDTYPELCDILAREYERKSESPDGVWYERRGE